MLELQFFVDGIFADVLEDRGPPRHRIVVLHTHVPRLARWGESFSKHLWFAIVIAFLAKMGRISCCGRPESSSSNI